MILSFPHRGIVRPTSSQHVKPREPSMESVPKALLFLFPAKRESEGWGVRAQKTPDERQIKKTKEEEDAAGNGTGFSPSQLYPSLAITAVAEADMFDPCSCQ